MTLFTGFGPKTPQLPASPTLLEESEQEEGAAAATQQPDCAPGGRGGEAVEPGESAAGHAGGDVGGGGIAPEVQPRQAPQAPQTHAPTQVPGMQDRGLYHAADAMREMYDMGDAPSCNVCGAIMVRNGSCYRCMSCGSTSGCS